MPYVDGFILAVPKDKIEDYKAMASLGAEVWKELGPWPMSNASATTCPMAN